MAADRIFYTSRSLAVVTALGALAFGAVHCSSDDEPTKPAPTSTGPAGTTDVATSRAFFISDVYPSIEPTCGSCHSSGERGAPIYLAKNAEGSYTAVESTPGYIAAPTSSPIMQKGLHSGPPLMPNQVDIIDKWLRMEVNARKLSGNSDKPANLRAAFKAFAKCMSFKRWVELDIPKVALTDADNNAGQCRSCHNAGQSSLWLSGNPEEDFDKFTQYPYVQKLVVGKVNESGAFEGLESSRRLIEKGNEAQQQQANSHPRFTLSSQMSQAITTFVVETLANLDANHCDNVDHPDAAAPPPQQ